MADELAAREALLRAEAALFDDGLRGTLARLSSPDGSVIDWGVTFLEAAPRCRKAGYITERILKALTKAELNDEARRRLAKVISDAVVRDWVDASPLTQEGLKPWNLIPPDERWDYGVLAVPREFRLYGRLAGKLSDVELTARLTELSSSADKSVRLRAQTVLTYSAPHA